MGDDYIPNTSSVKFVTNQLDITGEIYTSLASRNIGQEFNDYINASLRISPDTKYSLASAKNLGASKDGIRLLSYGMEDLKGLLYATLGKGEAGERQFGFYEETLLNTLERGNQAFEIDMAGVNNSFKIARSINFHFWNTRPYISFSSLRLFGYVIISYVNHNVSYVNHSFNSKLS